MDVGAADLRGHSPRADGLRIEAHDEFDELRGVIASGATRLLLTGDVPRADEAAILARDPALRAGWLAVPHHGSRSSSGAPLLETLGATSAVAQAGYRNRFGHPDAEVIARYRANNVRFFRTDYAGAVQWRFAGGTESAISQSRETDARYWHNRPGIAVPSPAMGLPEPAEPDTMVPDVIPGPPESYVHS